MVTLYVVRHCEAAGNHKRVFQGSSDCDITELGSVQLVFLSERFKDIKIDKVYSSPLTRAKKTAHAIADPKNLPVTVKDELTEICGGIIEGMSFDEIFERYNSLEYTWEHEPHNFAPEKGEAMRSVYERIWGAVREIIEENDGKTVVIASHGAAIRNLICRVTEGDIERLKFVPWSENTAVSKLVFDEDMKCKVEFMNDSSHVPPEYMPKRSRILTVAEAEE